MPEFTVKEVRLPELHMPEIKREEIVRSLSGVRLPDVDLAKARDVRIKVPAVTLTTSDVGKLLAAGTAILRFVRPAPRRAGPLGLFGRRSRLPSVRIAQPRRRRRWRLIGGLVVLAAIGTWFAMRRPALRQRAEDAVRQARERIDGMRSADAETAMNQNLSDGWDKPSSAADRVDEASDVGIGTSIEAAGDDQLADSAAIPAFEESSR
jgi:hypothetical protein